MPILRPHWSYSQLSQYMRCPLQYFFERVVKVPKPFVPSGLVLGSAVHEALAEYHRTLQQGREPNVTQIEDSFRAAWKHREADQSLQYKDGESRDSLIDQGIALLEVYQREAPPTNIVGVEQTFTVPLVNSVGEYLNKPLVAVLDLLVREATGLVVNEFKTTGRKYGEFEAETALQATAYAHAVEQKYDEQPLVRYTVLIRTKTPQVQRLETTRSSQDMGRLGDVVESIERGIHAGAFYPIESPQNCAGCAFRKPCREWSGATQPLRPVAAVVPGREPALC